MSGLGEIMPGKDVPIEIELAAVITKQLYPNAEEFWKRIEIFLHYSDIMCNNG